MLLALGESQPEVYFKTLKKFENAIKMAIVIKVLFLSLSIISNLPLLANQSAFG